MAKRPQIFSSRVNKCEHTLLRTAAKAAGVSLSDFARIAAVAEAQKVLAVGQCGRPAQRSAAK